LSECESILLDVLRSDLHEEFKSELEKFYKDLLRFFNAEGLDKLLNQLDKNSNDSYLSQEIGLI
jgi:hypothetical protein